jgi:hypothetical protein
MSCVCLIFNSYIKIKNTILTFKLTHIVDKDVTDMLCQADLCCYVFWLRNAPVIGNPNPNRVMLARRQKN